MTGFIHALPMSSTLRIWDNFVLQGEKILVLGTLTLFKLHQDQIIKLSGLKAWKFLKELPKKMYDGNMLIECTLL